MSNHMMIISEPHLSITNKVIPRNNNLFDTNEICYKYLDKIIESSISDEIQSVTILYNYKEMQFRNQNGCAKIPQRKQNILAPFT